MNERRFCTLYVDGLVLGIAIELIEEVLRGQIVTPVPLAHPDVAGLLNLRGQIVTTIDARRRLCLTQPCGTERDREIAATIVVLRFGGEAISILVDRVGDVVEVSDDHLVDVPPTASTAIRALTTGAYTLDGALMLVLDPDEMLAVAS